MGTDYTLFALSEGIVKFDKTSKKRVHVIPLEQAMAEAKAKPAAPKPAAAKTAKA